MVEKRKVWDYVQGCNYIARKTMSIKENGQSSWGRLKKVWMNCMREGINKKRVNSDLTEIELNGRGAHTVPTLLLLVLVPSHKYAIPAS